MVRKRVIYNFVPARGSAWNKRRNRIGVVIFRRFKRRTYSREKTCVNNRMTKKKKHGTGLRNHGLAARSAAHSRPRRGRGKRYVQEVLGNWEPWRLLRANTDQIGERCHPELLHLIRCHPAGIQRQRPQVPQRLQVTETGVGHPRVGHIQGDQSGQACKKNRSIRHEHVQADTILTGRTK